MKARALTHVQVAETHTLISKPYISIGIYDRQLLFLLGNQQACT